MLKEIKLQKSNRLVVCLGDEVVPYLLNDL